jgi:hypothetical protein
MKKVLIALCFMLAFAGISSAQTAKKKAPVATKLERVKPAIKVPAETEVALKKDGTPDRRFKANKMSKVRRMKKDGTADMRFKSNKKKE